MTLHNSFKAKYYFLAFDLLIYFTKVLWLFQQVGAYIIFIII